MTGPMDKDFWETHWRGAGARTAGRAPVANPYLAAETGDLLPGTALDAGCGEGAEAVWLAERGWDVTAADISAGVLALAREHAERAGVAERVRLVEADLSTWEPDGRHDLVTTHYAHPAMPQLAFYERLARWVAPGGTLLVVGHLRVGDAGRGQGPGHGHGHGHDPADPHEDEDRQPPVEATVTARSVAALLDPAAWDVLTARETSRSVPHPAGGTRELHDVVVRAVRRP